MTDYFDDDLDAGPWQVIHLPTEAEAFPYDGTNAAAIAEWAEELADYEGGLLILHTKQGDMSPDVTDVVILDRPHNEIYPIKRTRYDTNWAPMGET